MFADTSRILKSINHSLLRINGYTLKINTLNDASNNKFRFVKRFVRTSPRYTSRWETRNSLLKSPDANELLKKVWENPRLLQQGFVKLLREFGKYYEEKKHRFSVLDRPWLYVDAPPDHITMAFKFDTEDELKLFGITADSDNDGGFSTATVKLTDQKTALITGQLCTTVPENKGVVRAGYVNFMCKRKMKSFFRPSYYNWECYSHLVLKVRGDGRTWMILLSCPYRYVETYSDQYCHPLYTRGGPHWQITKIPFTHFFYSQENRTHFVHNNLVPGDRIARLGFTLADNNDGPFKLEIEYIGLQYIRNHLHVSPYEDYQS